jgi:hypothetical protein
MDSSLVTSEEMWPTYLKFLFWTFNPQNYERINFICFKILSLWHLVIEVLENYYTKHYENWTKTKGRLCILGSSVHDCHREKAFAVWFLQNYFKIWKADSKNFSEVAKT